MTRKKGPKGGTDQHSRAKPWDRCSAKDWDRFLSNKYDHRLWEFAHSIIDLFYFKGYKFFYPPKTEFPKSLETSHTDFFNVMEARIKKKEKLPQIIYKVLAEEFVDVGWIEKKRKGQKIYFAERNLIDNIYELRPFMKRLRENIILEKRLLYDLKKSHPLSQRRGAPFKNIYQIAFLWSEVMQDKKGFHWNTMIDLLNYFEEKLKSTAYKKYIFDSSDVNQERLRIEYWHVMKRDRKDIASIFRRGHYLEHLRYLKSLYFPNSLQRPYFEIKFSEEYIDKSSISEAGPVIVFPDGERFLTSIERPRV